MEKIKEIESGIKANLSGSAFSRSPVDIIIPFHGEHKKVVSLVSSILRKVQSNPYQICLVDDASPNKFFIESLKDMPQIFTLRLEERVGFSGALKAGFEATKQPWVIFMHSDCVVEDGNFMIEMGRSLLSYRGKGEKVKMVSARTNHAGEDVDPRLVGVKDNKTKDVILTDTFLPMYCTMCHRDLFKHVGGFLKSYPYYGYEDEEFAYRMRFYGFKQAICGRSWVFHEGGGTIDRLHREYPELTETVESNREKCLEDIKLLYSRKKNGK